MRKSNLLFLVSMLIFSTSCKKEGCTDQLAINYNKHAQVDDGSCEYADPITDTGVELPILLSGVTSSELILKNHVEDPDVVEYYVDQSWIVRAKVTVEPGVRIQMKSGATILIDDDGSFNAQGTTEDKINIAGELDEKGYWEYILVNSNSSENHLVHCNISNGGGVWNNPGMITLGSDAMIKIQHTSVTSGSKNGIFIESRDVTIPDFESNFIDDVEGYPLVLETLGQADFIDNSTTYGTDNLYHRVLVNGETIFNDIVVSKLDIPYYLNATAVYSTGHIKVEAGTEIIIAQNQRIIVEDNASLELAGTATDRIVIRGDQAVPGFWGNIKISSNNVQNKFSYSDLSNGGALNTNSLVTILGGRLSMDNSDVSQVIGKAVDKNSSGVFIDNGGNSWSNCSDGGGLLP